MPLVGIINLPVLFGVLTANIFFFVNFSLVSTTFLRLKAPSLESVLFTTCFFFSLETAIFGILIYFLAYLPIHDKPNYPVRSLIITLAINIATIQILLFLFGARNKGLPKIFGFGRFEIFDIPVRYDQAEK